MRFLAIPVIVALGSLALAACNDDTTAPSAIPEGPSAAVQAAAANSWITRADMLTTRSNLAVATVTNAAGQSIVYTIGGTNPNGVPLKTVTAYNVATNTWTFRRALPVALAWTNGAAVINGKIYISGGFSDYLQERLSNALYMYDPVANTWTRKRDMPSVKGRFDDPFYVGARGTTGVINGKLYVVTGCYMSDEPWPDLQESGCYETSVEPAFFRYNPVTDQWAALPSPETAFGGEGVGRPYTGGIIGGKFYLFGSSSFDRISGRLAAYDPATNRWTPKNALGLARPGAAAAVLGGKLYIIGGTRHNDSLDPPVETLNKAIAYDPTTNLWTTRAPMPSARSDIAATVVQVNGQSRIEVIGGPAPGNNLQYAP
jgi:Kelch motif protein/kelch motif-containing protein